MTLGWGQNGSLKNSGADVQRRSQFSLMSAASDWRTSAQSATAALSSTDGRWALLTTSLTGLIAGSIAWIALGTMPPLHARGFGTGHPTTLLPYQLFQKLAASNEASIGSFATQVAQKPAQQAS